MAGHDLRVESRFKNQRLWEQLEGTFRAQRAKHLGLVNMAAEQIGVSRSALLGYLNLTRFPWRSTGELKLNAQNIANYFCVDPKELFPYTLYNLRLPRVVARTFESPEILTLQQAQGQKLLPAVETAQTYMERSEAMDGIRRMLETLTRRERMVVEMRFGLGDDGEHTLAEIGRAIGAGKERVRQIEAKALGKLRRPSRRRVLSGLLRESAK